MDFVYLDQNHLSRMAKARLGRANEPDELALADRLSDLVGQGLVCCPFSFWHVMETIDYDQADVRQQICRLVDELSRGTCFRFSEDIAIDEIEVSIARATVGRSRSLVVAIGAGLDCFPREAIDGAAKTYIASYPRQERFLRIVELARSEDDGASIRVRLHEGRSTIHHTELRLAPVRDANRVSLAVARSEIAASLFDGELSGEITDVALRLRLPRPHVRTLLLRDEVRTVPTAAACIEVQARRRVAFGAKPERGDFVDAGHLFALPHVKWYLADRRTAAIMRDAGRRFGVEVLADPKELLARLSRSAGPGSGAVAAESA